MRLRRAQSLICFFSGAHFFYFNFLTKQCFSSHPETQTVLGLAGEWTSPAELVQCLDEYSEQSVTEQLARLCSAGGLVVEGSPGAIADSEYEKTWHWDVIAGAYHFSIKNCDYAHEEEVLKELQARAMVEPSPPLFQRNTESALKLSNGALEGILQTMYERQTARHYDSAPLQLGEVALCLSAGLRIKSFAEGPTPGMLPLKMTPSGGARNPYEGFLYALNVDGLRTGLYHYSGFDHSLESVKKENLPSPSSMLGKQDWTNHAGAVIFLVAQLERTMWKYRHPNAYRIVLIEAGHIAQNIVLAATSLSLASATTCALDDSVIESALGLKSMTEAPVYAIVLGRPDNRNS